MHVEERAILATCVFRDDVQQIVQMRLDEQLMTLLVVHLARGRDRVDLGGRRWRWYVRDSFARRDRSCAFDSATCE